MNFWAHKRVIVNNSDYLSQEDKERSIAILSFMEKANFPYPSQCYFTAKNDFMIVWKMNEGGSSYRIELCFPRGSQIGTVTYVHEEATVEEDE